ncbi:MAG: GerMN domain-containing protein [Anaerolineae bacterium]
MIATRQAVAAALAAVLCTVILSACANTPSSSIRTPTPPTLQPAAVNSAAPVTAAPSSPTTAETPPLATPPSASQTTTRVNIFLVALEDAGKSGKQIGCDDSIVAVEREVAPTTEPLRAALEALLAIRERDYGRSGLITVLYQSQLELESIEYADGRATVRLVGQFMLNGTCDIPRAQAQIEETIRQFTEAGDALILVNGTPLPDALSLK